MRSLRRIASAIVVPGSALIIGGVHAADVITRGDNLAADVSPVHGRIAMDLSGDVWILPATGGQATILVSDDVELSRPRWSPDGEQVLYIATTSAGAGIRLTSVSSGETSRIGHAEFHNQDASWHPDGERVVFASERRGTGLDLWETDLPTGLEWRLTDAESDEYDPAWAANGRHLVWVARSDDRYSLVLRRQGEPETIVLESDVPLSSPSWRPDGSLITYVRHDPEGTTLEMVILSEPVLLRMVDDAPGLGAARVSWHDRMTMVYTANGLVQNRGFEDRRASPLHFRALLEPVPPPPPRVITRRELEVVDPPGDRLIIRGARLFDGIWQGYRRDMDVVTEAGRVVSVEPRRDRDDGTVLDLGDVTIMPGLVDAWSAPVADVGDGPAVLAYGVTTLATTGVSFDVLAWEGEDTPGPRLLAIDGNEAPIEFSSIADASTPAVVSLVDSRQSRALGQISRPGRRFSTIPELPANGTRLAAASRPNRMPPGFALQAEMRAHVRAGLTPEQALLAASREPARLLGLENQIGTITPGGMADLVLIAGDPLEDIEDAVRIVAVVRNGRFFSLVSLLESAGIEPDVE